MTERGFQDNALGNAVEAVAEIPASGFHLFLRKECLHAYADWVELYAETMDLGGLFLSGCESSVFVEDYVRRLADYENTLATDDSSMRLLEVLKVCVPESFPVSQYLPLAKSIALQQFSGSEGPLPYFVRIGRLGKSTYLYIFFSERYYYPEGNTIEKTRSSDFYRDSVTGRRCKADNPNAVLVWSKGDVYSEEVMFFSKKERFFRIDKGSFYELISRVKGIMLDFFHRYIFEGTKAIFGRLSYDDTKSFAFRRRCRMVNSVMKACEEKTSKLLYAYQQAGFSECEAELKGAIKQWRKYMLQEDGRITLYHHTYSYTINFRSPMKSFRDNLRLMETRFDQLFDEFVERMQKSEEFMSFYSL